MFTIILSLGFIQFQLLSIVSFSDCKDTKVERNGKIYFDISEMKYRRERSESKIRKFLKPSGKKMHFLFRGAET